MTIQSNQLTTSDATDASATVEPAASEIIRIDENSRTVASFVPGSTHTLSGADAHLFTMDAASGELRFLAAPDYEAPADTGRDNRYDVVATDADGIARALIVEVANVNEGVAITSFSGADSATRIMFENNSVVTTFAARDADGDAIRYAIVGGADAAAFAIDPVTGVLSFLQAPDWEAPTDNGRNNVYDVVVEASDGALSDTQALAVEVYNSSKVTITSNGGGSNGTIRIAENNRIVTQVAADESESNAPVTYSISNETSDGHLFGIDPRTGVLSFNGNPDFEKPADRNADNVYVVLVCADSGTYGHDQQYLSIVVTNETSNLAITSHDGAATAALSIVENEVAVATVSATSALRAPAYSIVGGADAGLFRIDGATGVLSFGARPDFERPTDANGDGIYQVVVQSSDLEATARQELNVTVTDAVGGPVITSNGGGDAAELTIAEYGNGGRRVVLTTVSASGGDGEIVYSIVGGADAGRFYLMGGELKLWDNPDFERPSDANGDNIYDVVIQASDGLLHDTQAFTVRVTDVADLSIASNGGADQAKLPVAENRTDVMTITSIGAADPSAVTFYIAGGSDAALFAIDAYSGALRFVNAPDFEALGGSYGSTGYHVIVGARDAAQSDTQSLIVSVTDVSELAITSNGGGATGLASTAESNGFVATVKAAGGPGTTAPTYAISGGEDARLFAIDANTGALRFIARPDFERPNDATRDGVYSVRVTADDGVTRDEQALEVNVTDAAELVIKSNGGIDGGTVLVGEGDTFVTTVSAANAWTPGTPRYFIAGGEDASLFTLDPTTGALRFADRPDFETPRDANRDGTYQVVVGADDGTNSASQTLSVTVDDRPEVAITSNGGGDGALIKMLENGNFVTVVAATGSGAPINYAIAGGADAQLFSIDPATGRLRFVDAPDFEARRDRNYDNVYEVEVVAHDGKDADFQKLSVMVEDYRAPVITSNGGGDAAGITVAENGFAVTTVTRTAGPGSFDIHGGADAARFSIDPDTGSLRFLAAPDFEAPTDSDRNNVYDVIVRAQNMEGVDYQRLSVTIADVAEGTKGVTINGSALADVISFTAAISAYRTTQGDDLIYGGGGNDQIYGAGGNDRIDAGTGKDFIHGGLGADILTGGAEADVFAYTTTGDSRTGATDTILDFRIVEGDRIDLSGIDANIAAAGDQAFTFIGKQAFSGRAGELAMSHNGVDTMISADVNGDGIADFQLVLSGVVDLTPTHFVL